MPEIIIELSDEMLEQVSGGAGSATFTVTNTASGTTATIAGTVSIATTASSASLSGTFSSSSTCSGPGADCRAGFRRKENRPLIRGRFPFEEADGVPVKLKI